MFYVEPEQRQGLIYSVGLHLALVGLVLFSTQPEPIIPPKGIAIQAEIFDLDEYMKNRPKPTAKPEPPKPKPVEKKPDPVVKKPEPVVPKPEPKPPEPKPVVKPQIDPNKRTEKTERQKRLEELRRRRQEAEAAAQTPPPTTTQNAPETTNNTPPPVGVENGAVNPKDRLLGQYIVMIQAAVERQWSKPPGTPNNLKCLIKVKQIPGGGVIDVSTGSPCNATPIVRNSIINAVKKADPLPYAGFESVFDRRLEFIFENKTGAN